MMNDRKTIDADKALLHMTFAGRRLLIAHVITCIAFIIAGALGNIIDCVFYGKLFGYADWFFGRVVDMFYFPLIHNSAGEVIFFRPVFNFADSCITCAVGVILLFYLRYLR